MMSKKTTDLRIERVSDVNDYFCDNYDYLKKLKISGLNKGIHCFVGESFDGSRHFIKKCSKSFVRESNIDNPWNEITALHILSLVDSKYFPAFINAIEDTQYICVVSEYVDGVDLFDEIKKTKHGLEVNKAQKYLSQIANAVQELHDNNLTHLDLSTENIIIDKTDNIKLIDFGVCSQIIEDTKHEDERNSDHEIEEKKKESHLTYDKHIRSRLLPGKPGYRAPEIETRKKCDPKLCDAFSFGYIAWVILNGNMPFETAHPNDETYQKFMEYGAEQWVKLLSMSMDGWDMNNDGHGDDYDNNQCIKQLPANAIKMLDDLLIYNTYKRKSIEELLNDKDSFLHFECDEKKSEEKKIDTDHNSIK